VTLVALPDGRRAQLWAGGDPAGAPVFFLHGCPDSRHAAFPGDAAARRGGVRLVAVNRPGYGRSDPHDSGHRSVADDVAAVADLLGIESYRVLGMSVGGPYALACAARHPARVTSAAVVSAPGMAPAMDPPWHRDDLDDAGRRFVTGLARLTVEEAVQRMRPDFEAYVAGVAPQDPDDTALVERWLAGLPSEDAALLADRSPAELAAAVREALARPDGYVRDAAVTFRTWEFDLRDVRCPVSVWSGEHDANHPPRNSAWLARNLPDATLRVLPTGHLGTLLEHWDEILEALSPAAR
jgi:pimeloyl-ACP methyl ester carboxylesterase